MMTKHNIINKYSKSKNFFKFLKISASVTTPTHSGKIPKGRVPDRKARKRRIKMSVLLIKRVQVVESLRILWVVILRWERMCTEGRYTDKDVRPEDRTVFCPYKWGL